MELLPNPGQLRRGKVQVLCERKRLFYSALEEVREKEPYQKTPTRFCTIHRHIFPEVFLSITVKDCRLKGK